MDEETALQTRARAVEPHSLEAKVRQAILERSQAEESEVVGAAEIRDVAEAFARVTEPSHAHGSQA